MSNKVQDTVSGEVKAPRGYRKLNKFNDKALQNVVASLEGKKIRYKTVREDETTIVFVHNKDYDAYLASLSARTSHSKSAC